MKLVYILLATWALWIIACAPYQWKDIPEVVENNLILTKLDTISGYKDSTLVLYWKSQDRMNYYERIQHRTFYKNHNFRVGQITAYLRDR
jgi:hypothetical protein